MIRRKSLRGAIRRALARALNPQELTAGQTMPGLSAAIERELMRAIRARGRSVRGWTRGDFVAALASGEPGFERRERPENVASAAQDDLLERRIAKLTASLEKAELVISQLKATRSIDPGLASIYRSIQGLSILDEYFDVKREMLEDVFRSNLEFQQEGRSATLANSDLPGIQAG